MTSSTDTHDPRTDAALRGRTALVTGGARGLGAAISRRLAEAGARVALVGRDKDRLSAMAADLPGEPLVIPADLSEPDAPLAVLDTALSTFGRLDALVSNAGKSQPVPSHLATAADLDEVFALNVRAPLLLAGHAAGLMAESGGGTIVFVSSALSNRGHPLTSAYSATKGALDAATRALAAEWGPSAVRVNTVRPGITRSDMVAPLLDNASILAAYLKRVPLGRVGEPADVAEAVLFLSSAASAYITGQLLDLDGGWGATSPPIPASE
ncbi:SDR family NAD(P)-dependent oxidoreductase [Amycolatopsis halotolerans]|uniref:SDR family NAD(P)-dependent oxidoreductase n=1 Tax=Amycolatopsis halotolerans TaxID=330083 RepID=UPI0036070FA7